MLDRSSSNHSTKCHQQTIENLDDKICRQAAGCSEVMSADAKLLDFKIHVAVHQIPLGQKQLDFLCHQFSIADQDLLEGSYSEMLEDEGN